MIKNPSGRMVPRNTNTVLPGCTKGQLQQRSRKSTKMTTLNQPNPTLSNKKIIQKNIISYPVAEYISALVIRKRNIYLESQNYTDLQNNDVYEIISLNNNPKNALIEFLNYKPKTSDTWRPITKYIKKIQYNVSYAIENCDTVNQSNL
jgi:hypothetical protein